MFVLAVVLIAICDQMNKCVDNVEQRREYLNFASPMSHKHMVRMT